MERLGARATPSVMFFERRLRLMADLSGEGSNGNRQ
jgi:hypothetical protein